jgi:hypothetical protein
VTFTAIVSGVFAIAKAFPIVDKWISKFYNDWNSKRILESDQVQTVYDQEKLALNRAIQRAENDEDIKLLSVSMRRLERDRLSDSTDSSKLL